MFHTHLVFTRGGASRFHFRKPLHGTFERSENAGVALAIFRWKLIRFFVFHHRKLSSQLVKEAHDDVIHIVGVDVGGLEPTSGERWTHFCARRRFVRHVRHFPFPCC
jgi:hypothetical protein